MLANYFEPSKLQSDLVTAILQLFLITGLLVSAFLIRQKLRSPFLKNQDKDKDLKK